MAPIVKEVYMSTSLGDVVETNHAINARALGRPSQSGVAENLGGRGTLDADAKNFERIREYVKNPSPLVTDSELSWAGGMHRAHAGLGDVPLSSELERCAGVSAKSVVASEPDHFGAPLIPDSPSGAKGNMNMSGISNTVINNPGIVKDRR